LRPAHPTPWEARILGLCRDYFRQLDGLVGRIVAKAGPEARVFIVSDHGFGATETVFFANTWLAQQGYLVWQGNGRPSGPAPMQIAEERVRFQVEAFDWNRSVAFALNPSSNGIYIRRAEGPGSPGVPPERYEEFRARLASELLALKDPYTGEQFFHRVLTREEAFPGNAAARAPDLTLLMRDHGFLSVLNSDAPFGRRPEPWGTHYPEGIFAAAGPGIIPLGRIPRMQIVDVAPILLRSLGFAPEPGMEGRCPETLFEPEMVAAPGPGEHVPAGAASETEEDAEIEAEVLQRLQALGYIDPSCNDRPQSVAEKTPA
jgi:predicted AlkP superfamily phosphohydrolase/phosphomutase